jgi:acyl dehydratase
VTRFDPGRLRVGDELPELDIPMTATRIVAGALATRDFMPVHHDRDYANAQGAPDIFMNIMSTNGYCGRYLTDWAGPDALVRRLSIRLGVPVFPGSVLRFSGRVAQIETSDDEALVYVELRASTDLGEHASGSAIVALPSGTFC